MRDAIIHKWMRYCKQVFLSKVMIIRKAFLQLNPDRVCYNIFWQEVKIKRVTLSLKYNEFDSKMKSQKSLTEYFHQISREEAFKDGDKGITELPPLLDPDLSADRAKEMNVKWCEIVWKPECQHSGLYLDGTVRAKLPPINGGDFLKLFYRNFARDMPVHMEFIPRPELMRQMIKRAQQIQVQIKSI